MKIVATIIGVLIADLALIYWLSADSGDSPVPAMIGVTVLGGAALAVALTKVAPHWSRSNLIMFSGTALPALVWLLAFAVDVGGATYMRWFRPGESYMLGLSIILFLPCAVGAMAGSIAAWAARSLVSPNKAA